MLKKKKKNYCYHYYSFLHILLKSWLNLPSPPFLVLHTPNNTLMTQAIVTYDPKVPSALSVLRHPRVLLYCVPTLYHLLCKTQCTVSKADMVSALLEPGVHCLSHSHLANQENRVTQCRSDYLLQQML